MPEVFKIREGDTAPEIHGQPQDAKRKVIKGLSIATVRLHMFNGDQEILDDEGTWDAATDTMSYEWDPADLPPRGTYSAYFEAKFTNNKTATFPNSRSPEDRFLIVIAPPHG